jgi:malonyl CoA-acyl carrier protein transacylase
MSCFLFPGQPVAFGDRSAADADFQAVCARCFEITGYNPLDDSVSDACMAKNVRLQLFGVCTSLDQLSRQLKQQGPPSLVSEHSMGIYPALAACGFIDSTAALELTWRIGCCLTGLGLEREYALGSVVGLTLDPLASIAENNGVYIANLNTSRHFLLSGEMSRIVLALAEAEACGAFSVSSFPCDAPLHTPLIRDRADQLQSIISDYHFNEPFVPLIESLNQSTLSAADVPGFLLEELCMPVHWERTYRHLRTLGIKRFVELGSGTALSKFNRWIDSEL